MRIKSALTILAVALGMMNAYARPVFQKNVPFTQPDGSTFYANVKGDEFLAIVTTNTGEAITKDADGWWSYAVYSNDGKKESTRVHVGSKNCETIKAQSRYIPFDLLRERADEKRGSINENDFEAPIIKRILAKEGGAMTKGGATHKKHGIVIVCEYTDVKLAEGTTITNFQNLLTQRGYSVNGAQGCALDYFNHQFGSDWDFDFTVVGPVTLPHNQAYYGAPDGNNNDSEPDQMIVDAVRAADPLVDYSLFDDDGDGYIDNIFVFFAGKDHADDADRNQNCIWSHAWYLVSGAGRRPGTVTFDGVIADRYACTSELARFDKTYAFATIGTFCHEYSHTLGLPDYYDTDYESTDGIHVAAGLWNYTSLMDGGNMCNYGNTPPNYNCIDRELIGLIEPQTLAVGEYVLKPIDQDGAVCLRYDHPSNEGEYFLFECRSTNSGWDSYIYGNGLFVYHIDRSSNSVASRVTAKSTWSSNKVNAYHEHQCADLIEASAKSDQWNLNTFPGISAGDLKGLPFPYNSTRNFYSPASRPAFIFWNGTESQFSLNNITKNNDGTVSFTAAIYKVAPQIINYSYESFQNSAIISWKASVIPEDPCYLSIGKTGGKMEEIAVTKIGETSSFACQVENLAPVTEYTVELYFKEDGSKGDVVSFKFQTGKATSNIPAYIILANAEKDSTSGMFKKKCNIPLKVYNALDAEGIKWYYNENEITVGDNCYYNPTESGVLKAEIFYKDGTSEILTKKINIK